MYRFLLSRRWIGFAIFVIALATVCVWLGNWQFNRLDSRKHENVLIKQHFKVDSVPLTDFTTVGTKLDADKAWTKVSATGTYDVSRQFVLKYQTRDEGPGADVVTPFVLSDGNAILVDRGWLPTEANAATVKDIPAPPPGPVEIQGWIRLNSTAKTSAVTPIEGQVRAISSRGAAGSVPYELYDGYINLREQSPESQTPLAAEPDPDLGQGPHFFYALQWVFFALLAVFGWFFFARAEAKETTARGKLAKARSAAEQ